MDATPVATDAAPLVAVVIAPPTAEVAVVKAPAAPDVASEKTDAAPLVICDMIESTCALTLRKAKIAMNARMIAKRDMFVVDVDMGKLGESYGIYIRF